MAQADTSNARTRGEAFVFTKRRPIGHFGRRCVRERPQSVRTAGVVSERPPLHWGKSAVVLGKSAVVLGKSAVVLGKSAVVLERLPLCSNGRRRCARMGAAERAS